MDTGKKKSMAAVICIFLIFVTFASFCQSGDLYRRNCYFAGVLDHFVDFVSSSKGKIK